MYRQKTSYNQAGSSLGKLVVPVGVKHEALAQTGRKVKSKRSKLRCKKESDSAIHAQFFLQHEQELGHLAKPQNTLKALSVMKSFKA